MIVVLLSICLLLLANTGDNDRAMDAKLKALRDALEKQLAALRAALEAYVYVCIYIYIYV